ncbi:36384_t:CDS:1, partial [Racocetra persica]
TKLTEDETPDEGQEDQTPPSQKFKPLMTQIILKKIWGFGPFISDIYFRFWHYPLTRIFEITQ